MSNKGKNNQGFFKNIRNGSEAKKARLTWFLVILFMLGVFSLWLYGAQKNFSQIARSQLVDLSGLPGFPDDGIADVNLDGALKDSGKKVGEYLAASEAQRQAVGDDYIKEHKVLDTDGFSSLKFVGSKEEDGAILLEYAQYYKDVPVLGNVLVLSIAADDSSVTEKNNNLVVGIDVAADPVVSLKAAATIAEKENGDAGYVFKEGSLVIVGYEGKYYLAWKIVLASGEGVDTKDILVGAQRGNVIPMDAVLLEKEKGNQTSDIVE